MRTRILLWISATLVSSLSFAADATQRVSAPLTKGAAMTTPQPEIKTARLTIRRFAKDDWKSLQALGQDIKDTTRNLYDHAWPTDEAGAKGMADWCAKQKECWAVCLQKDGTLIGFVRFNGIEDGDRLDLGHVFHSKYRGDGYGAEALRPLIDLAFANPKVGSVITMDAADWPGQLTPLVDLGFVESHRGKSPVFNKDPDGKITEFTGCRMTMTRDAWRRAAGTTTAPATRP